MLNEFMSIITISILAVISPGSDFAMILRNSVILSPKAGVLTAVGIAIGIWVHIIYTILGLGLVIQQSILLFTAIKIIGAAYLIYLGLTMLFSSSKAKTITSYQAKNSMSSWAALKMGFLTNALNPKASVFIVSVYVQVISPETPFFIQLSYGAIISLAHLIWFSIIALFFASNTVALTLKKIKTSIDRLFGVLLTGFGLGMIFDTLRGGK